MVPTQYRHSIMAEQAVVDTRHRRCHSLGARMVPGGIFSGFLSSVNRLAGQIAPHLLCQRAFSGFTHSFTIFPCHLQRINVDADDNDGDIFEGSVRFT